MPSCFDEFGHGVSYLKEFSFFATEDVAKVTTFRLTKP